MQDDNNFETIIKKWRRLSDAELAENKPPALLTIHSMSGDSSNHETLLKKKDEESVLIVPEGSGHKSLAAASSTAVVASEPELVNTSLDEKQEFIKRKGDDGKEAAGDKDDSRRADNEESRLQIEKNSDKELKPEGENLDDNVDSVVLRSRILIIHKNNSNVSTPQEEEDCGMKCLYYTLQCCDLCALM